MKGDRRGMRVALVSDAVLNPAPGAPDRLGELAAEGWGVIALPPRELPDAAAEAWRAAALDEAAELARHGATVGVLLDPGERWSARQLALPALDDVRPGWRSAPVLSRTMSDDDGLDALSSHELHDRAVSYAKRHLDVKFFWELMRTLPTAEAAAGDLGEAETDVMRLSAHVDDVTEAGKGEVADLLRPVYLDYLRRHGVTAT